MTATPTSSWWRRGAALGAVAVVVVLAVAACGDDGTTASGGSTTTTRVPAGIADVRQASSQLKTVPAAEAAGYQELRDSAGIECIDMPGEGAMGVHYVDQALVGDGVIDVAHPEAVVFEPHADGSRTAAAVEYVVLQQAWDPTHPKPPSLYGHEFALTPAGNRFGLPAYYSLHVWAWKGNPAGSFAMWNPDVACSW